MKNTLPPLPEEMKPQKSSPSVRTTFCLPQEAIEASDWLSDYWDVTKKAVFGLLLQDTERYRGEPRWEEAMLSFLQTSKAEAAPCVRKTYVIERADLKALERLGEKYEMSRDDLVGGLLIMFKGLSEARAAEQRKKLEEAAKIVAELVDACNGFESRLRALLGRDDVVASRAGVPSIIAENLLSDVQEALKTGSPVKDD